MANFFAAFLPVWIALLWTLVFVGLVTDGFRRAPGRVLGGYWADLVELFADDSPACPRCGQPSQPLGRTHAARWWYCGPCGHTWPEQPADQKAIAS